MIRFIKIGDQITDSNKDFAFYDTVTETFCTFSGVQRWNSIEDFKQDYTGDDLGRYLSLIPNNFAFEWGDLKLSLLGQEINITPIHYYTGEKGKWQQIENLELQLKHAVINEDYFEANRISRQIKKLKS